MFWTVLLGWGAAVLGFCGIWALMGYRRSGSSSGPTYVIVVSSDDVERPSSRINPRSSGRGVEWIH